MAALVRGWARRWLAWRRKPKAPEEPRYKNFERRGEEIYDEMYETSSPHGYLSEIKECFEAAIAAAESEGLAEEAQRLQARLDHNVTVYRRQVTLAAYVEFCDDERAAIGERPIDLCSCFVLTSGMLGSSAKPALPPRLRLVGNGCNAEASVAAAPIRNKEPHHVGHRGRLRARFMAAGAPALADYELIELVLFRAIPQRDVKPLAKELIAVFGSFAEVIAAPRERLAGIKGLSEAAVIEFKIVEAAAQRLVRGSVKRRSVLSSWSAVLDYCRTAMAFADTEALRILFLDKKNQLIADEEQQKGTVDHTPVYPREVVKRALELSATAVILVHNHPSGDPTPSRADIEMTQAIVAVARPLGIAVHDHIIVGKDGHASLKGMRLI